ncbi:hypothetical protein E2C01_079197 [Portunus trituberculatus]|uniref:Uncharacterized protein n=1 Tax=Portunus trituberculatus TaxID=210409 RepID=A0A5B7IQT9_PORTR|nr:hypothetical protein [Portunus trituberculatus]
MCLFIVSHLQFGDATVLFDLPVFPELRRGRGREERRASQCCSGLAGSRTLPPLRASVHLLLWFKLHRSKFTPVRLALIRSGRSQFVKERL